jgi:hypothetical protein
MTGLLRAVAWTRSSGASAGSSTRRPLRSGPARFRRRLESTKTRQGNRFHDAPRRQSWWLVDPEGFAFWSAGLDCVRVDTSANCESLETALAWLPDLKSEFADMYENTASRRQVKLVSYLAANMIRAFGPQGWRDKWARLVYGELRRLRFNTVGNWSEWEPARRSNSPRPPDELRPNRVDSSTALSGCHHRDFQNDAAEYASVLKDRRAIRLCGTSHERADLGLLRGARRRMLTSPRPARPATNWWSSE